LAARMQQRNNNTNSTVARRISISTHSSTRNSWMYRQDSQSLSYVSSFANSSYSAFELQASNQNLFNSNNNNNSEMQQHRLSIFTSLSGSRYIHDEKGKPIRIPDEAELLSSNNNNNNNHHHNTTTTTIPATTADNHRQNKDKNQIDYASLPSPPLPQSPRRFTSSSSSSYHRTTIPTTEDSSAAMTTTMMMMNRNRIPQPPPFHNSTSSHQFMYSSRFSSSSYNEVPTPGKNHTHLTPGSPRGRNPPPPPQFDYNHTTPTTPRGHSQSRFYPRRYSDVIVEDRDFHHHPHYETHVVSSSSPRHQRGAVVLPRDQIIVPEPIQPPVPPRNVASAIEPVTPYYPSTMESLPSRRCLLLSNTKVVAGDDDPKNHAINLEMGTVVVPTEHSSSSYHERCVTCTYCHVSLRVAVSTILVQCPDCGSVSPASTNHNQPQQSPQSNAATISP
jgi:hypothetical protein